MNPKDLFDYRDGVLYWRIRPSHGVYPGDAARSLFNNGYHYLQYQGRTYKCADVIWQWHGKTIPSGMELDHLDRDRGNDRVENLEPKTRAQNIRNTAARNELGVKGVELRRGGYRASVWNKKKVNLGTFPTLDEAIAARDAYESFDD
jgi:hypothetical protein